MRDPNHFCFVTRYKEKECDLYENGQNEVSQSSVGF